MLTGNHKTLRTDLMMDVGSSINPAIDIGQVEGAFVQGMGWSTIEEIIYSDDDHTWVRPRGSMFTTGPGTYKIPAFNDTPQIFNVSLLENVDNPFAVHSSKAIGEPPFFLGTSVSTTTGSVFFMIEENNLLCRSRQIDQVFYAIKDAVMAARKENTGEDSYFEFRMPATSERIRMYAADRIAGEALSNMRGRDHSVTAFQPQGSY